LVFVLLVSVGMSSVAPKMARARRQKEAIARVEDLGGYGLYDYEYDYCDKFSYRIAHGESLLRGWCVEAPAAILGWVPEAAVRPARK
jgi:hypothetical protein